MCRLNRTRDFERNGYRLVRSHRTLERPTFDVLEHQVIRPNVIVLADPWMVKRGNGLSFPVEAALIAPLNLLIATTGVSLESRAFQASPFRPP